MWALLEVFLEVLSALVTVQDGYDRWKKKEKKTSRPPADPSPPPSAPIATAARSPLAHITLAVGGPFLDQQVIEAVTSALGEKERLRATIAGTEPTSLALSTTRLFVIDTRRVGDPTIRPVAFDHVQHVIAKASEIMITLKDDEHIRVKVDEKYYNQLNEFAARLRSLISGTSYSGARDSHAA